MEVDPALAQKIKAATVGLSHSQREGFALDLASIAAGEEVQFLRCDRRELTGWLQPHPVEGARFTDAEKKLIQRCGLTESHVWANLPSKKRRPAEGPIAMTDQEKEALRKLGHDPAIISKMKDCHSPSEFLRLKAEVEGGAS